DKAAQRFFRRRQLVENTASRTDQLDETFAWKDTAVRAEDHHVLSQPKLLSKAGAVPGEIKIMDVQRG
ncbi:hypothetical protein GY635_24540, partial [Escherichia coli]|uniref:hypothetical protein n=1 Tax=Escherichia coli TaxID=562 RepID=UPI0015C1408A